MAPKLFSVLSRRYQDPFTYYTKDIDSFIINKLAQQLCNQGHDSIFHVGKGHKFWTIALEHLCKVDVGSCIDFAIARHQVQIRPCEVG